MTILCDEETYLLALIRYIHLNPIRAKVIQTMEELDRYPWSGHRAIIGKKEHPWMDVAACLAEFGGTRNKAISEYRRFVREGIKVGRDPSLTGGGLVRSQGEWSQVVAMRRRGQKEECDERILVSGAFVTAVFKEAEDRQVRQTRHKRSGQTIQKIIDAECKNRRIHERELKAGGKRQCVSAARAVIACRCREELGSPAAELARHVGVNTSSII